MSPHLLLTSTSHSIIISINVTETYKMACIFGAVCCRFLTCRSERKLSLIDFLTICAYFVCACASCARATCGDFIYNFTEHPHSLPLSLEIHRHFKSINICFVCFFVVELCAEEKPTSFKIQFNSYKLTQLSLIICYRLFLSMCCRLQERKKFLNRIYYVLNGAAWMMRCDAIMVIYNPSEFFSIHTFAVTLPKFVEPQWIWYIGRPPNLIILEFKYSTEAGTHQSYFFICLFARSVYPIMNQCSRVKMLQLFSFTEVWCARGQA